VSAELPMVLHAAHKIVSDQLERLRALAEETRQAGIALSGELRQGERQLDELALQRRLSVSGSAAAENLAKREVALRTRCEKLAQDLRTNQHALKQLEQLISQIEMSSSTLISADGSADPWALALRAQVIHGREEERVRLAREVHDGPAQVLANSLMILETCYSQAQQIGAEKLVTMLDRMRSATRDGMRDVRRFIADLRPGLIEEQGLVAAINDYIRGYVNAYNAHATFEADPIPRLASEIEIVLYRIVQEALQNAYKYARGAHVVVRLSQQPSALHLTIRDNGPGFDPHEVVRRAGHSSWGLTSMRERAELVGARFTVASRPGHGTEVTVVLPMT
jgi:two-component system sensor histidine kinase DegS